VIVRLALALGLLLVGLLLYETVWASGGHAVGACFGQSWDNKTGPDEIWWKTVTACNDHPAEELQFSVDFQTFNWDDWTWHGRVSPIFWHTSVNPSSFLADSGYRTVDPGGSMACYRIRVVHFAVEWTKGGLNNLSLEAHSVSWGECY
jgi:hypothetical protein